MNFDYIRHAALKALILTMALPSTAKAAAISGATVMGAWAIGADVFPWVSAGAGTLYVLARQEYAATMRPWDVRRHAFSTAVLSMCTGGMGGDLAAQWLATHADPLLNRPYLFAFLIAAFGQKATNDFWPAIKSALIARIAK